MTTPAQERPLPILTPDLRTFWQGELRRLSPERRLLIGLLLVRRYGLQASEDLGQPQQGLRAASRVACR